MDLQSKKIDELREIAKTMGLKSVTKYKKADLIAMITEKSNVEHKERDSHVTATEVTSGRRHAPRKDDFENAERGESAQQSIVVKPETAVETSKTVQHKSGLMLQGDDDIVGGILEVLEEGYGFLRGENYLSTPKDV